MDLVLFFRVEKHFSYSNFLDRIPKFVITQEIECTTFKVLHSAIIWKRFYLYFARLNGDLFIYASSFKETLEKNQ